jgi:phosphinothricin acetyltransferase
MDGMIIRAAKEKDAENLLGIYAPYVKNTAVTFEYDVPSADEFAARIRNTEKNYPYLVAEEKGAAVGYAYANAFRSRAAYMFVVETTVYVEFGRRREGIGRKLYAALEKCLAAQGIINLYACIAHTEKPDGYLDNASEAFHEKTGYRPAGIFRGCGYKFNRFYDMVWMEKRIGSYPENPRRIIPFDSVVPRPVL